MQVLATRHDPTISKRLSNRRSFPVGPKKTRPPPGTSTFSIMSKGEPIFDVPAMEKRARGEIEGIRPVDCRIGRTGNGIHNENIPAATKLSFLFNNLRVVIHE
jgi:hypothetical protein